VLIVTFDLEAIRVLVLEIRGAQSASGGSELTFRLIITLRNWLVHFLGVWGAANDDTWRSCQKLMMEISNIQSYDMREERGWEPTTFVFSITERY
jgi:hypothetical protein